jgi:hypothetical protein
MEILEADRGISAGVRREKLSIDYINPEFRRSLQQVQLVNLRFIRAGVRRSR